MEILAEYNVFKSYLQNISQTWRQINNILASAVQNNFCMAQQQQCGLISLLFQMIEITNNWHNKKRAFVPSAPIKRKKKTLSRDAPLCVLPRPTPSWCSVFGIRWPVLGVLQCLQLQCQMAEAAKDQSAATKAAPGSEWKENHTNLTGNNNNKNKDNKI